VSREVQVFMCRAIDYNKLVEENKRLRESVDPPTAAKWWREQYQDVKKKWLSEKARADKFKTLINDASVLIGNAEDVLAESDDNTGSDDG